MSDSAYYPVIHGHRGCRGLRPENTLPAFRHAVQLGVEVIELDVVVSADNRVVVSHEPWMSATICRTPAGLPISASEQYAHNLYTLPYAEIVRYDCGLTRHAAFPEQQPEPAYKPLLSEVVRNLDNLACELGRAPVRYSIELKSDPAADGLFQPLPGPFLELVLQELRATQVLPRTTLLCFDKRILQLAHRQLPTLPLCLLVEDVQPFSQHLEQLGFTPAVYGPQYHLVTPELAAELASLAVQLVPWTVNDPTDFMRLLALRPAGITTDYPNRFLPAR
ncbi:glycerophosphodiester phosphodiesterase family protein [Hymenobacter guriensis]|uniref:Glycerophosphodiester phosphodiesterase n=1 Tax=Hymenobacter guriensis TaxID=2793065 RepID=A0ABS0L352_9BACT|nr:glycerophosphodiester phosphodiesterase family protein [Hymenobacter guriensis]MBG8554532.1 glycerophosphodiester phosphodiesterase [Hymenobacter guriensis]